ncbi:MAG: DUF2029 domain-containing protein [Bacteroidales bacterium]|jgi:hypothetical protein|nr:DUF2029 domain-containing protein [Bacteroidales bacterium]
MIKAEKRTGHIYLNIFVASMLLLFILFTVGLFKNPMGVQRNIFFVGLNDLFADFFNVLRYISERDPYFNTINGSGEKIYLPFAYLLLYPFSQLDNFNTMTLQQAWTSKMGIMSAFWFTAASFFFLFLSLNQIRKQYGIPFSALLVLCFSCVFIFSIERGNLIVLSAAFVSVYLSYYDSDDKNKRVTANICLALAAVLKIYPVLLGFLYLGQKQYKDIFRSAIITLLLTFVPFVFFRGGFSNVFQLINNIRDNSETYNFALLYPRFSFSHLVYCSLILLGLTNKMVLSLSNAAYYVMILVSIFSICCSLLIKNKWIKITLLILVLIYLPVNSGLYCGLYLFPVIILFFATPKERSGVLNGFILIVFIILLNPFQFSISYRNIDIGINYLFGNVALLSLWLVLLIISGKEVLVNKFKLRKYTGGNK